jgi:hypothetical protein
MVSSGKGGVVVGVMEDGTQEERRRKTKNVKRKKRAGMVAVCMGKV